MFFIFNNIQGFQKLENKVFPGLSIYVIKNDVDTVLSEKDLFADLVNGTDLSPLQLQANLTSILPYKNNEKYVLKLKIWDKKGEGSFFYELPFSVKQDELLEIKTSNVKYSSVYLWNDTKKSTVTEHVSDQDDQLLVLFEGVEGLIMEEGKVYPQLSIELVDNEGVEIVSVSNLFTEYELTGVDPIDLKGQMPITLSFGQNKISNPVQLKLVLRDLKSENSIQLSTTLKVQ